MNIQIVPTLLTHSLAEFKSKLKKLEPYFALIQIDCADGKFVKNKTFYDINKIKKIRTKVNYELHLMVKEPLKEIKKWENFKKVKKIIFHYEALKSDQQVLELIEYLKKIKIKAGLAVNPETKVEKVKKFIPKLDLILFLGVKPGWGGQKFQPRILNKIRKVRKLYPKLDIEVDGGVNLKNAKQIIKAGANILAAGSLFIKSEYIRQTITQIKNKFKK